jgi:hypothetical protein
MKTTSIVLILLALFTGCSSPAPDAEPEKAAPSEASAQTEPSPGPSGQPPETVREMKSLTGEFIGFEAGDYLHAVIRQPDGNTTSFFLERGMELFLVDHRNEPLELTYQVVETDIPEAGGITTIERLSSIRAGDQTFADWWTTAEPSFGKLLDEYQPRIEQATLEPGEVPAGEPQ